MRAKKTSWDKTGVQYFCQYGDKKKTKKQPKNKVMHIYFRHYRIRNDHKV
jgi:hypothetical protein